MASVKSRASGKASKVTDLKDRIVEMRKMRAGDVKANPKNWRTHPKEQRAAFRGLLGQIGFADPVLARVAVKGDSVCASGRVQPGDIVLMDGHLRGEEVPADFELPVIITDLTEQEADLFLASADPLSALAGQDDEKLIQLLDTVDSDNAAIQKMLAELLPKEPKAPDPEEVTEQFQILIECADEGQQAELLDELMTRGLKCRSLMS